MTTKAQLEKMLSEERKKNERLHELNDTCMDGLKDIASGFGLERHGKWSPAHLAANILTKLAKKVNQ